MTTEVLTEFREDGIALITINRPEAFNALNRVVALAVAEALDELDRRDDVRIGIITGAGGTFCSGMDLKAFLKGESPVIEGRGLVGLTETPPRKPLIAAVEGYALAGAARSSSPATWWSPPRTPSSVSPRSSAVWLPPPAA